MAIHDAYARMTPYELSFPDLEQARSRFGEVGQEARSRGVDLDDPAAFLLLGSVGQTLKELRPDVGEGDGLHPHGLFFYHAYHFWVQGEHLYFMGTPRFRSLAEAREAPLGGLPAPAGYVQLPQHLLWTDIGEGQPPESVDGFFWTAPTGKGEAQTLLVAGVRGDRPGFSIVSLPAAPAFPPGAWGGNPEGEAPNLASGMPGADLDRLYQVRTAGDVLLLIGRVLNALEAEAGTTEGPEPGPGPPRPSALPCRRGGGG